MSLYILLSLFFAPFLANNLILYHFYHPSFSLFFITLGFPISLVLILPQRKEKKKKGESEWVNAPNQNDLSVIKAKETFIETKENMLTIFIKSLIMLS